jgi:hypothetical protein
MSDVAKPSQNMKLLREAMESTELCLPMTTVGAKKWKGWNHGRPWIQRIQKDSDIIN